MRLRRWPVLRRFYDLRLLTLFVTTQCNSRCQTCFYWRSLNNGHGMTLEQIEALASSAPHFRTLLIGGGEPTLRPDLPEIVATFRRHNQIHDVSVPTNGLLPDRIASLARQIASENPDLYVSFNVSLDGFEATHDQIRGVPGNLARAIESITRLAALRATFPNLSVVVNSVICSENCDELVSLAEFAWENLPLDGHFFEIIRGDPKDLLASGVPADDLAGIYRQVVEIQARYARRARQAQGRVGRLAGEVLDVGRLLWQYRVQYRRYSRGALWPARCRAGQTIGVVEPDGTLRACELRGGVAQLADHAWDLGRAWYGTAMSGEVKQLRADRCDCTHVCFVQSSRDHSLLATFVQVPWLWLRYKRGRAWL